jgi:hypothetical protein
MEAVVAVRRRMIESLEMVEAELMIRRERIVGEEVLQVRGRGGRAIEAVGREGSGLADGSSGSSWKADGDARAISLRNV